MANEAPEQMLDVFRTAALSVTKLYKSSITAQAKARSDGYQDCLDDLLQYLDKENLGLDDGEGWKIRAWANERLEARDTSPPIIESDDDAEKIDRTASPDSHKSNSAKSKSLGPISAPRSEPQVQTEPSTPLIQEIAVDEPEIVVPTQETFDFRSSHPYPQDTQSPLNIANLRLSDARAHDCQMPPPSAPTTTISVSRTSSRGIRHNRSGGRHGPRAVNRLGHGAGAKRKVNFGEFFDLGNLDQSKDTCGGSGNKRTRHM